MKTWFAKQNILVKILLLFFLTMITLTILSRITYNFVVPSVVIGTAAPENIDHIIRTQGIAEPQDTVPVYTVEGLIVSDIKVNEGQLVKEGEGLFSLDKGYLNEKIAICQSHAAILLKQYKEMKKGDGGKISSGTLSVLQEYNEMEDELQHLCSLRDSDGVIKAPSSGTVAKMGVQAGDKTSGEGDVVIAGGKTMIEAAIPADEESGYINRKTSVSLILPDGSTADDLDVDYIRNDKLNGNINLSVDPGKNKVDAGQTVEITLHCRSKKYSYCVPRSALHMDSSSYFVYTTREEDSILGEETIAVRTEVQLLDKNMEYAAVEGVTEGQQIIIRSDRELQNGTKVKVIR